MIELATGIGEQPIHSVLAVDPGKTTGWAWFWMGELKRCGRLPSTRIGELPIAQLLVIEEPVIRRRHPRPNDILKLAVLAGEIAGRYTLVRKVKPEEWKRQLPKKVCWERAKSKLTMNEMRIVKLDATDHNVKDAIALGLWALGRFK